MLCTASKLLCCSFVFWTCQKTKQTAEKPFWAWSTEELETPPDWGTPARGGAWSSPGATTTMTSLVRELLLLIQPPLRKEQLFELFLVPKNRNKNHHLFCSFFEKITAGIRTTQERHGVTRQVPPNGSTTATCRAVRSAVSTASVFR